MRSPLTAARLVRQIMGLCLVASAACGTDYGAAPTKNETHYSFMFDGIAGRVVEVGSSVTFTAWVFVSGGGFFPNEYLNLDDATWSSSNPGVAVVESAMPSIGVDQNRTSTAVIRAVTPGQANVSVQAVYANVPSTPLATTLWVMPAVRVWELRSTRDTIWAGESATVTPYVELVNGTDPSAYLDRPYLDVVDQPCSIQCPANVESLGGSGYRVIANGLFSGVVTFYARLGQRIGIYKSVVVLTGPRSPTH